MCKMHLMTKPVIYEQPLNERVRTFLRLEHLFCQTDYTLRGFSVWDSRASLDSLVDTLDEQHEDIAQGLTAIASRQRAATAYGKGATPNSRPAPRNPARKK